MARWTDLNTYWTNQISTAVSAGTLEPPYSTEATALLARWMDALAAYDNAIATDLSSYTIAQRSAAMRTIKDMRDAAASAKSDFLAMMYNNVTYADFRTRGESIEDDIT